MLICVKKDCPQFNEKRQNCKFATPENLIRGCAQFLDAEKDAVADVPLECGVMPLSYKAYCKAVTGNLEPEAMRFDYIMNYLPRFEGFDPNEKLKKELEERKKEA